MRVVLDTNVLVAALLVPTGVAALVLRAWSEHRFTLLYNTELILELREVMARPRLKARVKRHRVGALIRANFKMVDGVYVNHFRGNRVKTTGGLQWSESTKRPKPVRCCFQGQEVRQRICKPP